MDTILITGCAGFIGSNFATYYLKKHPNVKVINLDAMTYAGSIENVRELLEEERHVFVRGSICDRDLVTTLFLEHDIKGVINFAAESHVDNSINRPSVFVETNINGTFTLLDIAYKSWMDKPFKLKVGYEESRFLQISTDEVYGSLGEKGKFKEDSPYLPNSPYSASKAASDHLVRSYFHTYGLNVVTTNCSNNYGPKQHREKFVPTIIKNALNHQSIPIYGDGLNVRDWLYVIDHCRGIDLAFNNGMSGETYNIGGGNERTNIEVAEMICKILDEKEPSLRVSSYRDLISFVGDRPGHDRRYAIDATKIETQLGWKASEDLYSGMIKTVDWYLKEYSQN